LSVPIDRPGKWRYLSKLGQKRLGAYRPKSFLTIWVWEAEKKISERN
jgi:hypothetical protein